MFTTPILFLVFNRPAATKKVFAQIRKTKPSFLFVAADGPRENILGEKDTCEEVRNLVLANIDWDCEVKTLFRKENLGCGKAVSQAITWFFENVEEGIILEDDCLPDLSFFPFCEELLARYRTDDIVMSISGSNLLGCTTEKNNNSYFWGQGGIWGWATWKRAWKLYDYSMEGWKDEKVKNKIRSAIQTEEWFQFYYPMFEASVNGTLNTWDVQWFYTILYNGGLSINPRVNLVKNIGFGTNATHTLNLSSPISKIPTKSVSFPLNHPNHRIIDIDQLHLMYKSIQPYNSEKVNILKRILKLFLSNL